VTYCQQAGARAHDRAAFREAATAFEQALQALEYLPAHDNTGKRALELRLALGGALIILGEYGRHLALLGEAETLASALNDRDRLGRVLGWKAALLRITGDPRGAIAAGQQALALAVDLGERALQGHVSYSLGLAYYAIGDVGQAVELLRHNVEAADGDAGTPSADMRIRSRAWLARTLSALGAFAEGRHHGEEALRLAPLEGRGDTPMIVYSGLGFLSLTQGHLAHAVQMFDQGLALCRTSGNRVSVLAMMVGLGAAYALQGRLREGRALVEEAIHDSRGTGALGHHAWRVTWLSEVCRLAGRDAEAWAHAHHALTLARQQQAHGDEAQALHQLGTLYAHTAPPDVMQAEAHYAHALTLANELGLRPLVAHCHHGLGTLYGSLGRREQAHVELSVACALYRAMAMPFWLPQTEAALAQVDAASAPRGQDPLAPSASRLRCIREQPRGEERLRSFGAMGGSA
jgi:tetratricopeptide (TPR) repeat protein